MSRGHEPLRLSFAPPALLCATSRRPAVGLPAERRRATAACLPSGASPAPRWLGSGPMQMRRSNVRIAGAYESPMDGGPLPPQLPSPPQVLGNGTRTRPCGAWDVWPVAFLSSEVEPPSQRGSVGAPRARRANVPPAIACRRGRCESAFRGTKPMSTRCRRQLVSALCCKSAAGDLRYRRVLVCRRVALFFRFRMCSTT